MESQKSRNGLATRKEVLGEKYVEAAMDRATEFSQPMQELLNEYCWGHVWSREGLSRATRSLLNIAMMAGTGPVNELRTHVKGALRNGCTAAEIQETILQAAVYKGVPAGVDGFRVAGEAIAEYEAEVAAATPANS